MPILASRQKKFKLMEISIEFSLNAFEIPHPLFSIPLWKFHVLNPSCLDFFWNSPLLFYGNFEMVLPEI